VSLAPAGPAFAMIVIVIALGESLTGAGGGELGLWRLTRVDLRIRIIERSVSFLEFQSVDADFILSSTLCRSRRRWLRSCEGSATVPGVSWLRARGDGGAVLCIGGCAQPAVMESNG
jgi:hypothetical protein